MAEDTIEAHGRAYKVNNPGGLIGRPIADGRPYEQKLLEHIYSEDHQGVGLDIGAHIGNHALWMAAVCGLQVHAFEPLHFERLRENVELNGYEDRITVHPTALGAKTTRARLYGKDRLLVAEAGSIPVTTLDSFGIERVSVIKIDVEDMEPQVLLGGEETIRRDRPVIYAEARDQHSHDLIALVLEPWGYRHTMTAKTATPVERWAPA